MDTDTTDDSDKIVAYAYELRSINPATGRERTGWSLHVDEQTDSVPSEDNFKQDETTQHELRNVTPLVEGDDPDSDAVVAYKFTYESFFEDETKEAIRPEDPRGSDALVSFTPLVPQQGDNPFIDETPTHRSPELEWPHYYRVGAAQTTYYRVHSPDGPVDTMAADGDRALPFGLYELLKVTARVDADAVELVTEAETPFAELADDAPASDHSL